MIRTGLGQAEGVDTRSVVNRVILTCRSQINGFEPQAGIVLAGSQYDHTLMLALINDAFPGIQLIGCTTAGNFATGAGFSDDGITLAVIYSDDIEMGAGIGLGLSKYREACVQEALQSARGRLSKPPALCLTFPARDNVRFKPVLDLLGKELGTDCPVFGGTSAILWMDDMQPLQFFGREILTDSLPVLLMAGHVKHAFSIANSWRPLGKKSLVTEASGRTVRKIGELSAVNFYRHYLGFHEEPAMEFLLAVYETDKNEFYLRVPVTYHEDGSVSFSEPIPQGAFVQLTEAVPDDLTRDVLATTLSLRNKSRGWEPALGLAFSCSFRKQVLGTGVHKELDIMEQGMNRRIPVMGFYGSGEFAPLTSGGKSLSHVATLVSLVIGSESKVPDLPIPEPDSEEPLLTIEDPKEKISFLERKLKRSEHYRQRLELTREFNSRMLRQIISEVDDARRKIKHKEKELRRSEEKFRRIVQTTGEGFLLLDESFTCIDVNDALCRMTGYSRSEIIGGSHLDLATEQFREFLTLNREELVKNDSRRLEGTLRAKDGSHIPILGQGNTLRDDQGEVIGHMAFITDMTEQKKALALAGEVQRSLMPREIPQIRGLDVAGKNRPCEEVGGDYYDFFWQNGMERTSLGLAVGDISGHGVDAALLMTSVRTFLRLNALGDASLPEIINGANQHLVDEVSRSGRFMTLFFLNIDRGLNRIEWVRAGHDPAMIFDPKSGMVEELKGPGMALGVDKGLSYQSSLKTGLKEGQVIAVGTDGIWETFNKNHEMFGKERFMEVIQTHIQNSAQEILDAVFTELDEFSRGIKQKDDATLVIIKILTDPRKI